ncbi:hypothetical protein BDZ90DRAFT_234873 [Jaminaea rosea]|uniref:Histone deacetylase interacting domain-containing protein n=1 Tax=Jaminaea rosea TaxID=1569628 RepID=A0A316UJR4_9BASI|nr:hypothetical protein BDZ90DRAFT_234873 [Jaminaea rosea]PWN24601.1 hypothetical protein BDZ90DRAFT_234873 [Jaminaea rosea]
MATLNVKDALSYLDQVKVQFADHPDVYNRFLDIMKDFKSQSIDTPGVIERVSTLFRGHPSLIQGFNTFLPPGYRIECSMDPSEANLITVTTPSGTTTQKDGAKGIAGAVRQGAAAAAAAGREGGQSGPTASGSSGSPPSVPAHPAAPPSAANAATAAAVAVPAQAPKLPQGSLASLQHGRALSPPGAAITPGAAAGAGVLSQHPQPPPPQQMQHQPPHPAAGSSSHGPPLAAAAAEAGPGPAGAAPGGGPPPSADGSRPPLEFNHAINYVNKIKQRFSNDPETYKQFLEILQTYQKEGRAIQDVYAQVTVLFEGAKDLLDEFKQFLPDTSAQAQPQQQQQQQQQSQQPRRDVSGGKAGPSSGAQTQRGKKRAAPAAGDAAAGKATQGAAATGRSKKAKHGHKGQQQQERMPSPAPGMPPMIPPEQAQYGLPPTAAQQLGAAYAGPDGLVPADAAAAAAAAAAGLVPSNVVSAGIPLGPAYAPLATLDEVAFFDRVKKHIDDRGAYLEFLKLLNLYTQDVIDVRTLVDKAAAFIGGHRDLFATFKSLCGYEMGRHGWLEEEEAVIENTPALERPRIDLNTCEQYGASYRRLPKEEVNLACSGRDAMCWEVLNDEWVSHPTWASEGEGFNPHKKNIYEDALYRSEEERHEYDYHIEANLRTIALLEPIAARIAAMDEQERATFRLKPGLGGQSRSIYQRVLRKVYGRDAGAEIVAALHDSPSTSIPVVLARLRQKDEEWKRAQREWNKVWRVVDERNWWKSLDHRGVSWKASDKKAITTRGLLGEIELRRSEDVGRRWMKELGAPRTLLGTESGRNVGPNGAAKTSSTGPAIEGNLAASQQEPWHLSFDMSDRSLIYDVIKLALSHLDRGPSYSRSDIDRIEMFIRSFLPLLMGEDAKAWEDEMGLEPVSAGDDEEQNHQATSSAGNAERRRKDDDLRMRVLRGQAANAPASTSAADGDSEMKDGNASSETAVPTMEQTWIRADTRAPFDSQANAQQQAQSSTSSAANGSTSSASAHTLNFFCSSAHYTFLRLFHLAYVRLAKMKRLSTELGKELDEKNARRKERGQKSGVIRGNPLALQLGLQDRFGGIGSVVGSSAASAGAVDGIEHANGEAAVSQLPSAPVSGWELHPSKYYMVLLDLIEKLFDGDSIDQNMYEESIRFMFGIEGFVVFTIDKVLGGLVKATQSIINDSKCAELQALLDRDRRSHPGPSGAAGSGAPAARDAQAAAYRHQIATRMSAECLVGKEEHLFRVGWTPSTSRLGIQMLSRDDPSADLPPYLSLRGVGATEADGEDAEKLREERWLYYVASYALWAPTEGLVGEVRGPFLRRSLGGKVGAGEDATAASTEGVQPASAAASPSAGAVTTTVATEGSSSTSPSERHIVSPGLEIKVCLSTYRLFFVADTEDTFARQHVAASSSATDGAAARESRVKAIRAQASQGKKRFDQWVEERRRAIDEEGVEKEEEEQAQEAEKDEAAPAPTLQEGGGEEKSQETATAQEVKEQEQPAEIAAEKQEEQQQQAQQEVAPAAIASGDTEMTSIEAAPATISATQPAAAAEEEVKKSAEPVTTVDQASAPATAPATEAVGKEQAASAASAAPAAPASTAETVPAEAATAGATVAPVSGEDKKPEEGQL